MENPKYKIENGRCVALRDFGNVKAGDVGGFVGDEQNLSHNGNCWVFDDARVCGHALIFDDAQIFNDTHVSGTVMLGGYSVLSGGNFM